VWELVRALEDDERAERAFLALGGAGVVTWFATLLIAQSLLPAATIASVVAVVCGLVGWRGAKQGDPREASNVVAVVLAVALAACWLYLSLELLFRLV
jgi:hypothetical protein